ncbi:MAG: ABC transporter substrate-binding protein [Paracoccaceae bacterium]
MRFSRTLGTLAAALLTTTAAQAACGIDGEASVRILSNDFEALHRVGEGAMECAGDGVEVELNQTVEHKTIQVPALTTDPATYTVAVIANNSIVPLLSEDLIRPLDAYIEAHGENIQPHQQIRMGDGVMAIAFMANGVHLFYREDILEENGVAVPTTMDELFAGLETLREAGMEYPFASNFQPGWDLAAEFVNLYLGTGEDFFANGTAELDIENETGAEVLETMAQLASFMRPAFVTDNGNTLMPLWKEGEDLAFMFAWGSRARELLDTEGSDVAQHTAVAAMPAMTEGGPPAAALWWDGFTIAKNVPEADAEASFIAMANALGPDLAAEHGDTAVWLTTGYEPMPPAVGVNANIQAGARSYPMVPYMGILHTALGENLGEFIQGRESAEQALADITQAYETAAREQGFLQ